MPQHFPSFDSSVSFTTDFAEKPQADEAPPGTYNEELSTLRHRAHRIGNHQLNFNRKHSFTFNSSPFNTCQTISKATARSSKQLSSFPNCCSDDSRGFQQPAKFQNDTDNKLLNGNKGLCHDRANSNVPLFHYESSSNCDNSFVKKLVAPLSETNDLHNNEASDVTSKTNAETDSKCPSVPLLSLENSPPLNIPSLRMGTPRSPHTPHISGNPTNDSGTARILVHLPAESNVAPLSTFQDLPSVVASTSFATPVSSVETHPLATSSHNTAYPITNSPAQMLVSNSIPHIFATPPGAPTVYPITYSPSCSVSQQCQVLPSYYYPSHMTAPKINSVDHQIAPKNNLEKPNNVVSTRLNGVLLPSPKTTSTPANDLSGGGFTKYQSKDLSWTPTYPLQTVHFPNFPTSGPQLSPLPPPLLPYPSLLYTCSGNQTKPSQLSVSDFTLHHSPAITSSVLSPVYTQPLEVAVCTPPQNGCQSTFPVTMPLNTTFAAATHQLSFGPDIQKRAFDSIDASNNSALPNSSLQKSFQQHYQNTANSNYNKQNDNQLKAREEQSTTTTTDNYAQRETIFGSSENSRRKNDVRLFVGRIPKWYTSKELKTLFEVFGPLNECSIIKDRNASSVSQGCGFVRFHDIENACAAIAALNQNVVLHPDLGPVQVKFATGELQRLKLPLSFQPGGECVKVFIGNLSTNTSENELYQLFRTFGPFEELCILRDKHKRSKCSGFVTFNSTEDAESAILTLDGRYYMTGANRPLEVRFAESKSRQELKSTYTPLNGTKPDTTHGLTYTNENSEFYGKNTRLDAQTNHRPFRKHKSHPASHNDRIV